MPGGSSLRRSSRRAAASVSYSKYFGGGASGNDADDDVVVVDDTEGKDVVVCVSDGDSDFESEKDEARATKKKTKVRRPNPKRKRNGVPPSNLNRGGRYLGGDAVIASSSSKERNWRSSMTLKAEHALRPLWVTPDLTVYLEVFSKHYARARDFLSAIADPVSQPKFIHVFALTKSSLFSALSLGLNAAIILEVLGKLSKCALPDQVKSFVENESKNFGVVKLLLKEQSVFMQSISKSVLELIMNHPSVAAASSLDDSDAFSLQRVEAPTSKADLTRFTDWDQELDCVEDAVQHSSILDSNDDAISAPPNSNQPLPPEELWQLKVPPTRLEAVRKCALETGYPLTEEYAFTDDSANPDLPIQLRKNTNVRSYQQQCLSRMFTGGRARSGLIVLPCGAGKTLTGIAACGTVKKSTIVLCTSYVAVEQWRSQYKRFSTIPDNLLVRFTSKIREPFPPSGQACILLTTYSMMAKGGKRSEEAEEILQQIRSIEWGLILLDEVHVVPARLFRRVLSSVRAHLKLGLSATLLREDSLISDLFFLIGPKLYEGNWLDLTAAGYLASVSCKEVWCPMSPEFCAEYLCEMVKGDQYRRQLLSVLNPNKMRACEHLMKHHEARNDKVIIFCDNITALNKYAEVLNRRTITGSTPQRDRLALLGQFRTSPIFNTLIISKVGDVALDIPEATVVIQVSSHFGSRRQEAQRLGRILRPKPGQAFQMGCNAHFYTLVSRDTHEMKFCTKRQQFLVDIGYYFEVDSTLCDALAMRMDSTAAFNDELEKLLFVRSAATNREKERARKRAERDEAEVAENGVDDDDVVIIDDVLQVGNTPSPAVAAAVPETALLASAAPAAKRTRMSIADLSGAPSSLFYEEYDVADGAEDA